MGRAIWISLFVVAVAALIYLTFINRNWPAPGVGRILLLALIAMIAGVALPNIRRQRNKSS